MDGWDWVELVALYHLMVGIKIIYSFILHTYSVHYLPMH